MWTEQAPVQHAGGHGSSGVANCQSSHSSDLQVVLGAAPPVRQQLTKPAVFQQQEDGCQPSPPGPHCSSFTQSAKQSSSLQRCSSYGNFQPAPWERSANSCMDTDSVGESTPKSSSLRQQSGFHIGNVGLCSSPSASEMVSVQSSHLAAGLDSPRASLQPGLLSAKLRYSRSVSQLGMPRGHADQAACPQDMHLMQWQPARGVWRSSRGRQLHGAPQQQAQLAASRAGQQQPRAQDDVHSREGLPQQQQRLQQQQPQPKQQQQAAAAAAAHQSAHHASARLPVITIHEDRSLRNHAPVEQDVAASPSMVFNLDLTNAPPYRARHCSDILPRLKVAGATGSMPYHFTDPAYQMTVGSSLEPATKRMT